MLCVESKNKVAFRVWPGKKLRVEWETGVSLWFSYGWHWEMKRWGNQHGKGVNVKLNCCLVVVDVSLDLLND